MLEEGRMLRWDASAGREGFTPVTSTSFPTFEAKEHCKPKEKVRQKYGVLGDPTKSAFHNVSLARLSMPSWYYCTRGANTACHNISTTNLRMPRWSLQCLLGLGLNLCVSSRSTKRNLKDTIDRFAPDI